MVTSLARVRWEGIWRLVVEGELALFLKEEDGGSGELFADGADAVAHRGVAGCGDRGGRCRSVEVNDAESLTMAREALGTPV